MNFKATVRFCTGNIWKEWVGTLPKIAVLCLQQYSPVLTLLSWTAMISSVSAESMPHSPEAPDFHKDRYASPPRDYKPHATKPIPPPDALEVVTLICSSVKKVISYFAAHGFKNIHPSGHLYTSTEDEPVLTRFNTKPLEPKLTKFEQVCMGVHHGNATLSIIDICHAVVQFGRQLSELGFPGVFGIDLNTTLSGLDVHKDHAHDIHMEFITYLNNANVECDFANKTLKVPDFYN